MEALTDICTQKQRLARYSRQIRRSHTRSAKKILYNLRATLKRLDRMQNRIQAQQRKHAHE